MATLQNGSANYISGVNVTYDFGVISDAGETITEELAGQRAYYSTTGLANSWTALGTFSTAGPVNLSIPALGTSFGTNPIYLLWADDNAAASSTVGEGAYTIDNFAVNATLGGPLVVDPPTPVFGTVAPNQDQGFETPGTGLVFNNGATGTVVPLVGDNALQLNNASLNGTLTEQVDLRSLPAGSTVTVGVDLKAWETSATSDFEETDRVAVFAEYSNDGLTFTPIELVDLNGAPALTPFDPNVPNPADEIRAAFVNTPEGAFNHYQVVLPAGAQTVRVRTNLVNNSATEFMAIDNITVTAAIVPEPATIAMFGLGLIGLVGYRRRRSA